MYRVCKQTFQRITTNEPKWQNEHQNELFYLFLYYPKRNCCKEALQSDPKPVYKKEKAHTEKIQGCRSRPEWNFYQMNKPTLLDLKVMGGCIFVSFWGTGHFMYLTLLQTHIPQSFCWSLLCFIFPYSPLMRKISSCDSNGSLMSLELELKLKLKLPLMIRLTSFSFQLLLSTALWCQAWDMTTHTQLMTHWSPLMMSVAQSKSGCCLWIFSVLTRVDLSEERSRGQMRINDTNICRLLSGKMIQFALAWWLMLLQR